MDGLLICTTLVFDANKFISGSWLLYSMHTGNCNDHLTDTDFLCKTQNESLYDVCWKIAWKVEGLQYTHKNVVQNLGIDMSTITV